MDVARPRRSRPPRPLILAAVAAGLLATTLGLSRLRPAAPSIERSTLWIDTVRRGPMVRQVHADGTLVPEDQRIVAALTAGRVDRVQVQPGEVVEPASVLVELSNPDVQLESLDAERQLKLAEAELAALGANLETARLAQEGSVAAARTALREAERAVTVAERLAQDWLTSAMEVERARDRLDEARERHESERRRMTVAEEALRAQVELRRADLDRLRAIARFQRERVGSMRVCAGAAGVVQAIDLQPGQWVQSGQLLARVASTGSLKALLRVPETEARDVAPGQKAVVDTRNGTVRGRVRRVDPAVQNGAVAVDLALESPLPAGARPDLAIDGTIEIERLGNVLSVGRPAEAGADADTRLFRLAPGGRSAVRVPVRLGRASFDAVEIVAGLREGDQVILSEMSRWQHADRVRIH